MSPSILSVARAARVAAAALLCAASLAQAAPMPNAGKPVAITAREQPIGAFLQDLFAAVDVPVSISPGLPGSVNGSFAGPAEKVLRDVARVYNLITYYDGTVMHVVPTGELTRRTYSLGPAAAQRLQREVSELGLADARNFLRTSGDGNLLATGTRRFVEQIDELLRAAQPVPAVPGPASGSTADFRVFYLRYAWAQDQTMTFGGRQVVIPGVANILRRVVGASSGAPLGSEVMLRPTQPSLRGQGLSSQGAAQKTSSNPREAAADAVVAALTRVAQPAEPPPAAVVPGITPSIEADPRLNAIIVRDQADRLPRYEQLIAALDVEPQSIEIEATIIDVNTDKARELGVNWRWNNDGREGSFSGAVPTTGAGGIASMVLGSASQFLARIRALQTEGAARVVSSPQVVTLSNVEAVFDSSSTFYVRVAGKDEVDLFNVSAGTSLRVTPNVFRDRDANRIKLMVNIEDGNLTGRSVDQIPVVERSTINTQALIQEGESLLVGGMTREATSSSTDKVPGLGDVPVVGNLFKTKSTANSRIERMFLITPRLAAARPTSTGTALRAQAPAAPAPVAAPAPLPVTAPAPAPVTYTPPTRASVVLDLDAPLPPSRTASPRNPAPAAARVGLAPTPSEP